MLALLFRHAVEDFLKQLFLLGSNLTKTLILQEVLLFCAYRGLLPRWLSCLAGLPWRLFHYWFLDGLFSFDGVDG